MIRIPSAALCFLSLVIYNCFVLFILPLNGYDLLLNHKILFGLPILFLTAAALAQRTVWREVLARKSLLFLALGGLLFTFDKVIARTGETGVSIILIFLWAYFLSCLNLPKPRHSRWVLQGVLLASLAALAFQFYKFRFEDRPALSVINPNYGAIIMLLFLFFSHRAKFYLGQVFSVGVLFFFLSRGYFYSIVALYLLAWQGDFLWKQFRKMKVKMSWVLFSVCLVTLLISFIFVKSFENTDRPADSTAARLLVLAENSNQQRFTANLSLLEIITANPRALVFGYGDDYVKVFKEKKLVQIHNSFLELLPKFGLVFFVLSLLFMGQVFDKIITAKTLPYFLAFAFYGVGMHSLLDTKYLLVFLPLLLIPEDWL